MSANQPERDLDKEFEALIARWNDPLRDPTADPQPADATPEDSSTAAATAAESTPDEQAPEDARNPESPTTNDSPSPSDAEAADTQATNTQATNTQAADTHATNTAAPDTEAPKPPGSPPTPEANPASWDAGPRPGVNVWRGPTHWQPPSDTAAAPTPAPDDDDDHFTPPPVDLPPQEDIHFWATFLGLVGGGLMLIYVALSGQSTSSWWFLGAMVLFIGGFALLVLRQPPERDHTDDGTRI